MRKFFLESYTGERLSLQTAALFFHKPDGLGFTDARDFFETDYGFYVETNKVYEQPNIVGELIFLRGNKYEAYSDLVTWLHNAAPMRLVYIPVDTREELLIDIEVESISKSELTPFGTLETPISFRGTSPYYLRSPRGFTFVSGPIQGSKRYTYSYPYTYTQNANGDQQEITPRGHFPAALELTANGPISNPVLKAINRNTGKQYGVLSLPGLVLQAGEQLLYSSRPNDTYIKTVSGDVVTNLIDEIDITNNNFFRIPAGVVSLVSFAAEVPPEHTTPIYQEVRLFEYFKG